MERTFRAGWTSRKEGKQEEREEEKEEEEEERDERTMRPAVVVARPSKPILEEEVEEEDQVVNSEREREKRFPGEKCTRNCIRMAYRGALISVMRGWNDLEPRNKRPLDFLPSALIIGIWGAGSGIWPEPWVTRQRFYTQASSFCTTSI